MELRSQKKRSNPNSNSTTKTTIIDKNRHVYLSINDTTFQIIDVSDIMESKMTAGEVAEIKADAVEPDLDEILPPELHRKIIHVPEKKTFVKTMKRKYTPATCDVCGKSYSDKYYLKKHKRRHEVTKRLKCTLCESRFNAKQDLRNHIKSHLKERAFSCAICDKRFTRKSLLNYHMRIHTGERPYECNICHFTFTRPFGLSQHKKRMHSRNKGRNIRCTEKDCDKMFVTLLEREEHIAVTHKRLLPHKCSLCKQSFSSRAQLHNHKSFHSSEEPYACPSTDCDKKFKVIYSLTYHVKSCHKDFMYKCPHCHMEFKKKAELNHHMKVSNSHKTSPN